MGTIIAVLVGRRVEVGSGYVWDGAAVVGVTAGGIVSDGKTPAIGSNGLGDGVKEDVPPEQAESRMMHAKTTTRRLRLLFMFAYGTLSEAMIISPTFWSLPPML